MSISWPVYSAAVQRRVAQAVARGEVYDYAGTSGAVVDLERLFNAHHGGRHCLSFNSGTSALYAAYGALGLGPGDEVVVPNFTFLATVSPLLWLGATPVLCDSDVAEPGVCVETISRCLTERTRAISVTHLFGNPVAIGSIAQLARQHNLKLIEDCSHAHASTIGGDPVGLSGDAAIYSVGSTKMVSGGHGGLLLTPHDDVWDAALLIGHFKPRPRADLVDPQLRRHAEFGLGGNLCMSPLAALLAIDHMSRLTELSAAKIANVAVLDEAVGTGLVPVRTTDHRVNGTFFDIVYSLPPNEPPAERDKLVTRLVAAGVPARAPSTRPINRVLRSIGQAGNARSGPLWEGLRQLAAAAPSDAELPASTTAHDRMVSFPSTLFHDASCSYAHEIAEATRKVLHQ